MTYSDTGTEPSRPDGEAAVSLRGLSKRFDTVQAVKHVNLDIARGEFLTLLGPSGSGKTTILRILAGFEHATEGHVMLEGRDIAPLPPNRRDVGMVFQNYALFPHMTVEENILYPLKMRSWSREASYERLEEVLALLRLEGLNKRRPHEVSGGQQQRVALGRALAFRPSLLLMDEPLGALDRALRLNMQEELRRIHREIGTTILYVTHDREESLTMSTRIAVLRDGALVQVGTPMQLFKEPINVFVAQFLGECNVWRVSRPRQKEGNRIAVEFHGDEFVVSCQKMLDLSGELGVLLRPSHLRLRDAEGDHVLNGTVTDVLYLGEIIRMSAEVSGIGKVLAYVQGEPGESLRQGQAVRLAFRADDLFCVQA